jgi:hypothetical protein
MLLTGVEDDGRVTGARPRHAYAPRQAGFVAVTS